jgi:hypothetical protein
LEAIKLKLDSLVAIRIDRREKPKDSKPVPETIKLETILKNNPQIDAQKLRASIELSEKLHNSGIAVRGYELPPPSARKRLEIVDSSSDDPRAVRLRHR